MCLPTRQNGVENRDKAYCNIQNIKHGSFPSF